MSSEDAMRKWAAIINAPEEDIDQYTDRIMAMSSDELREELGDEAYERLANEGRATVIKAFAQIREEDSDETNPPVWLVLMVGFIIGMLVGLVL